MSVPIWAKTITYFFSLSLHLEHYTERPSATHGTLRTYWETEEMEHGLDSGRECSQENPIKEGCVLILSPLCTPEWTWVAVIWAKKQQEGRWECTHFHMLKCTDKESITNIEVCGWEVSEYDQEQVNAPDHLSNMRPRFPFPISQKRLTLKRQRGCGFPGLYTYIIINKSTNGTTVRMT